MKANLASRASNEDEPKQKRGIRYRPYPWPLRCIAWGVIVTQFLCPYYNQICAGIEATVASPTPVPPNQAEASAPWPGINRTAPAAQAPPSAPSFSVSPADEEFVRVRIFNEPLLPVGKTQVEENNALAQCLLSFVQRDDLEDYSALTGFLQRYPSSPWRASLLYNLGWTHLKAGYFSKALTAWEECWAMTKQEQTGNGKVIGDACLGQIVELLSHFGDVQRLDKIFRGIEGRSICGPATEKISAARGDLSLMKTTPESAFTCGASALSRIRNILKPSDFMDYRLPKPLSTTNGISLAEVCAFGSRLNLRYQMAKRRSGAGLIVPAVIHWKLGHFSALVGQHNGQFIINDPALGGYIKMSPAAIESEASGYFLIPAGPLSAGWEAVDQTEGLGVWGKGPTTAKDTTETKKTSKKVPDCQGSKGMAGYSIHVMLVSLSIADTPIGYQPPRGPGIDFEATYNQREDGQPASFAYANLGYKWTYNWLSYVIDNPQNTNADVSLYLAGGGSEQYAGFNGSSFMQQRDSGAKLTRISTNSYERLMPDGSKEVFNLPDGVTGSGRKVFRTQLIDRIGNMVSNTYDANFRLVAIRDAVGQVSTISYGSANPADELFYKISQVTDPFGRSASFDYTQINGVWRLTKITDVIGVTSEFTYSGTNDFITSLKTPYGTTSFAMGENGTARWLEATDPLGQKERVEFLDWLDAVLQKDRRGHWTATYYDALRRVTEVQDSLSRGQMTSPVKSPEFWIDAAGQTNFFGYNAYGQLTALTNAKSEVVSIIPMACCRPGNTHTRWSGSWRR